MPSGERTCIVWGATGQAKVVWDILNSENVQVLRFFDNDTNVESFIPGVPVLHGFDGLGHFVSELNHRGLQATDIDCVAAIGSANGRDRENVTATMEFFGFVPRSVVHHSAIISTTARVGRGVQILVGAYIGPFASIGEFTIINSGASVDHDCTVGLRSHLAPRATLAGGVSVGSDVFIGTNATVLPRVRINDQAVVGAGSVVTRDVPAGVTVVGNPARALRR